MSMDWTWWTFQGAEGSRSGVWFQHGRRLDRCIRCCEPLLRRRPLKWPRSASSRRDYQAVRWKITYSRRPIYWNSSASWEGFKRHPGWWKSHECQPVPYSIQSLNTKANQARGSREQVISGAFRVGRGFLASSLCLWIDFERTINKIYLFIYYLIYTASSQDEAILKGGKKIETKRKNEKKKGNKEKRMEGNEELEERFYNIRFRFEYEKNKSMCTVSLLQKVWNDPRRRTVSAGCSSNKRVPGGICLNEWWKFAGRFAWALNK